jgi:uncharacterized protein DUF3142
MRRALIVVALMLASAAAGDSSSARSTAVSRLTLWAWERPEDLRFLAGRPIRVAFLERTLKLGLDHFSVQRRHQPLRVAPDTALVAVVRIETTGVTPDVGMAGAVADEIADSAMLPGVGAVQIDFDARRSDRPLYAALLRETRARLPRSTRLSITALASWCSDDPWLDATRVDEIVPMLFQMGPDARHIVTRLREDGRWRVDACNRAVGLATDEPWRGLPPTHDVYVFNPRQWRASDLQVAARLID